jgi:Tol biopolymer transport system component
MKITRSTSTGQKKSKLALGFIFVVMFITMSWARAKESAGVLLQSGLYEETIHGELEEAIEIFERILREYPDERPVAAQAQLHIGLCKEKLGRQEALNAYQKVVDNYPEQQEIVKAAKDKITEISKRIKDADRRPTFRKIEIASKPQNGVLSPDGDRLAFISDGAVWVVPLHGKVDPDIAGEPVRLAEVPGVWDNASLSAWSRNGEWIAVNGKAEGEDAVYVIPAAGGEPRVVLMPPRGGHAYGYRLSLSPDGQTLAFSALQPGEGNDDIPNATQRHIYTIPTKGGQPHRVSSRGAGKPAFSPDGKFIAYVGYRKREEWLENHEGAPYDGDLWVVPSTGGTPIRLARVAGRLRGPVWSRDGRYIASHVETEYNNSSKEIWVYPVSADASSAGEPVKIPLKRMRISMLPGWTPDGELGVFRQTDEHWVLYTVSASGGNAGQLTPSSVRALYPRWSPDGERVYLRVYYPETRKRMIASVPSAGGVPSAIPLYSERPLDVKLPGAGLQVSPDGKRIVFSAYQRPYEPNEGVDLWTFSPNGGTPTRLTSDRSFENHPCWSPDGQRIAFVDWQAKPDGEGFNAIYVIAAEGGEPKRISSESVKVGGGGIAFSPDGKRIAFFSEGAIKTIPVDGGEPDILVPDVQSERHSQLAYSPDGSRIAYNAAGKIWITPLDGGKPEELCTGLPADAELGGFDWSPDGERIVFLGTIGGEPEFWLVSDFLPETEPKSMIVKKVWEGSDVDNCGEISPDGKYLSCVDWDTGDLAVYEIATGEKRRLTNKGSWKDSYEFAEFSRWSTDSRQIAYTWYDEQDNSELRLIAIDGGAEPRILFSDENYRWITPCDWSKDGEFILTWLKGEDGSKIALISVWDGSVRVLKEFGKGRFANMVLSPERDDIVYDDPNGDIFILSLQNGKETVLVKHPANDSVMGWGPDGKYLLFASDRSGMPDIWAVKVGGGKAIGDPWLLKSGMGADPPRGLGTTKEGSFYYSHYPRQSDVYVTEIDPDTGDVMSTPREAINHFVGSNRTPDYSPDGKYVAYISRRAPFSSQTRMPGGNVLCIHSLGTGREREFRPQGLSKLGFPRWSPDSRSVLVIGFGGPDLRVENWEMGLYTINAETGKAKLISKTRRPQRMHDHAWSADGKSVFLVRSTMPEGGTRDMRNMRMEIVQREIASGKETQVLSGTLDDINTISSSPDGRWLAVLGRRGRRKKRNVRVIPLKGGEPRVVHTFEQGNRTIHHTWSADSRYIFVPKLIELEGDRREWDLCRIAVEDGKTQNLGLEMRGFQWLSAHPDGRHIAFGSRAANHKLPAVWVMENFLPE